nr:hypothetical protein [Nostoc sp. ChiSLP03a]MDZ8212511.1 hypothetical protein [Nostoc sp. ChiSLP03a]
MSVRIGLPYSTTSQTFTQSYFDRQWRETRPGLSGTGLAPAAMARRLGCVE